MSFFTAMLGKRKEHPTDQSPPLAHVPPQYILPPSPIPVYAAYSSPTITPPHSPYSPTKLSPTYPHPRSPTFPPPSPTFTVQPPAPAHLPPPSLLPIPPPSHTPHQLQPDYPLFIINKRYPTIHEEAAFHLDRVLRKKGVGLRALNLEGCVGNTRAIFALICQTFKNLDTVNQVQLLNLLTILTLV